MVRKTRDYRKRIAIVGGGALGIELAWALEKKVDVTLIEQRSHFICCSIQNKRG
ncbi:MAG: FAD-dependent oxidoreductase [Cyanobacteria bacterium P01_E01_bin.42]